MPNLREHAKDPAIGAVSQRNLEHVARILDLHAKRLRHPLLKWFYSDRKDVLNVELTAAVFSRVKGVPEVLPDQFDAKVRIAMGDNQ